MSGNLLTSNPSETRRRRGIRPPRGWLGIQQTALSLGTLADQFPSSVQAAAMSLRHGLRERVIALAGADSADPAAERVTEAGTSAKARQHPASAAVFSLSPNGRTTADIAQKPVVCVTAKKALSGRVKVRNLAVRDAHTFYANGILCHNCDALGLCGQLIDRMANGTTKQRRNDVDMLDVGSVVAPPLPSQRWR